MEKVLNRYDNRNSKLGHLYGCQFNALQNAFIENKKALTIELVLVIETIANTP